MDVGRPVPGRRRVLRRAARTRKGRRVVGRAFSRRDSFRSVERGSTSIRTAGVALGRISHHYKFLSAADALRSEAQGTSGSDAYVDSATLMSLVGTVAEIWRYPVKSMGGERLTQSTI